MSVIAVGHGYSLSLQRYFIFSLIENNNPLFWVARPAFETFFAFCDKKSPKNICITKKCCTFASQLSIGLWCNGNTADSGPAFPGSSPGSPTESFSYAETLFLYLWLTCTYKKADALAPALICLWNCLLLQSFADKLNKSILLHCSYLGYRLATHWNEEQGRDACDIEVVRKLG